MNGRSVNGQKLKQDDDILRNLPEGILHHIFSFLDIKDVVRTSILAKRWEFIWTSIPDLIFNVPDEEEAPPSFLNFVDRVLFLRDSPIKKFSIDVNAEYIDPLRLRGWISAVVRRNVEKLNLELVWMEMLDVPCRLFTCASLTHLRIFAPWVLKFPPSICLSSLKHLTLEHVTIPDAESIKSLISGCPLLETLFLIRCQWQEGEMFYVCAPKLSKLIITEVLENYNRVRCGFMISGPSLKHFHYAGDFFYSYCLYDVPSLVKGHIHVRQAIREEIHCLYKLLKGLSHLKVLSLPFEAVEALNNQTDLLHNLPLFNTLNFLTLTGMKTEIDCKGLTVILQHCPRLKTICFKEGVGLSSHCNTDQGVLEPVPPCFLSHLKTIKINFSRSNEMDLDEYPGQKVFVAAVKILLKRAPLLEKLILHITKESLVLYSSYYSSYESADADVDVDNDDCDDDDDQVMDVGALINKLKKLCRASRLCQVQLAVLNWGWSSNRFR